MPTATPYTPAKASGGGKTLVRRARQQQGPVPPAAYQNNQERRYSAPKFGAPKLDFGYPEKGGLNLQFPSLGEPEETYLVHQITAVSRFTPGSGPGHRRGIHVASPPSPTPRGQQAYVSELDEEDNKHRDDDNGSSQNESHEQNENDAYYQETPTRQQQARPNRQQQQHQSRQENQTQQPAHHGNEGGGRTGRFGKKAGLPRTAPQPMSRSQAPKPRHPSQHRQLGYSPEEDDQEIEPRVESGDPEDMNMWRKATPLSSHQDNYHVLKKPSSVFPQGPGSTASQYSNSSAPKPTFPQHPPTAYLPSPASQYTTKNRKERRHMNEAPQMDPFHPEEAYPEGSFRHFHDAQAGAPGEFETMEEDDEYGDYMGGHHHGPPMGHGGSRVKELKTEIKKESKRDTFALAKFNTPLAPLKNISVKTLWDKAAKTSRKAEPFSGANDLHAEVNKMAQFLESTLDGFSKLQGEMNSAVQKKKEWTSRHESIRKKTANSLAKCDPVPAKRQRR